MVKFSFTFCAFYPLFISNTSIVSINFGANLDAQNAGNDISGNQISYILYKRAALLIYTNATSWTFF